MVVISTLSRRHAVQPDDAHHKGYQTGVDAKLHDHIPTGKRAHDHHSHAHRGGNRPKPHFGSLSRFFCLWI